MASGYIKSSRRSRQLKDEEFEEEEIWGSMEDIDVGGSSVLKQRNSTKLFSPPSSSSTPRMIPRKEMRKEHSKRSSAPLTIPNRQMMAHGSWVYTNANANGDGDGDVDVDDDEIVPPHEYIARRLARTQISSFSVCEGVGRKLKGRDLSEVRNDVLRKTGFLER